ncbi:TraK family protein [Maridesulfovibrio sp.]|uniref:TraK family protein n=1 Tax=Maridesulfovibrio sp. TaxID=2795000 RepID=UPI002D1E4989|nr:TraK family protein [Maridesulfovibrio sp.]
MRVQLPLWVPKRNQGLTNNLRIVCESFFCVIFRSCPTPVPPFFSKATFSTSTVIPVTALFSCVLRHVQDAFYTSSITITKRGCMTSKIKPSQRGKGRVEYLGLVKEIEANLLAGHTRRAIHDHLKSDGRMTISYQRFCHYVTHYSPHCLPASELDQSPAITGTPAVRTVSALPVPLRGDGPHAGHPDNDSKFSFKKKVTQEDLETDLV